MGMALCRCRGHVTNYLGSDARPRARRGDRDTLGVSDMSSPHLYDTIGAAYTVTR